MVLMWSDSIADMHLRQDLHKRKKQKKSEPIIQKQYKSILNEFEIERLG